MGYNIGGAPVTTTTRCPACRLGFWKRPYAVNITRLRGGEPASPTADRIRVSRRVSGDFEWSGVILRKRLVVFGRQRGDLPSRASAEADGIAWAVGSGAIYLVIESDTNVREPYSEERIAPSRK